MNIFLSKRALFIFFILLITVFFIVGFTWTLVNLLNVDGGFERHYIVALLMMSLVCLLSVCTSLYLYFWRIKLINGTGNGLLVPEKWAKAINELSIEQQKLGTEISQNTYFVKNNAQEQLEKASNLLDSFMLMNEALDKKDIQIERLRKGYDTKIKKDFIKPLLVMDELIREVKTSNNTNVSDDINFIQRRFSNALEICGLEIIAPEVGIDYRTMGNTVADGPEEIATKDKKSDFLIESVVKPGYKLAGGDVEEIIRPAIVSIYVFEK